MKKTDGVPLHFRPDCIRVLSILLLAILSGVFGWTGYAFSEGSRSLYPASYPTVCGTALGQGCRADLDLEAALVPYVGQVTRSTFLYVYAQAGEYIVLGSANRSNGGDIYVYDPQNFGVPGAENYNSVTPGTPDFTCSGGSTQPGPHFFGGTLGTIATRGQELAGPNSADNSVPVTGGFAPCAYRAPFTGSYGVLFFAAPGGAGAPDGNISPLIIDGVGVSAWDVTVRANRTSTTDINGSLYTYAYIGYTGGNSRPIYTSLFYVTRDGYRYRQDLVGQDGNGYALYSNSLGFLDSGQPLYKDLRGNDSQVSTDLPIGVMTQTAENPTFFSDISPSGANAAQVNIVLSSLNIPLVPSSATVTNVQFAGTVSGSASYLGTGGTFSFNTTNTITYQIVISLDGINFDPSNVNNATLTGLAPSGSNTVVWNGTNNSNVNFPAGGPYSYQVSGRNGEIHFPMIDVENNYFGGPTITRLNGAGAPSTTVYYDDRGYVVSSGVAVGTLNGILCPTTTPPQPVPAYSLVGIDSSTSYRTWGVLTGTSNTNFDCTSTNAWGDAKAVNLWTYYSFTPALQTLTVISVNVDVATGVAGPVTATSGSTVQGTFAFANNGTAIAHDVTYTMSLSPGLGTVTFGNLPTGTTATYNNATGAVTFGGTDLPTTLTAGQAVVGLDPTAPMTYSYTAPASGSVTVSTQIATSDKDSVPSNNSDSITTYIGTVDVQTTVTVLSIAAPNGTVAGNIQFTNNGTSDATGVTYTATIGNSSFYPALITFTSIPTGVTPTYNNATGVITLTGLPSTLGSAQTFNIGFSYTAPSSGVIPVSSAITTTSTDVNPANNNSIAYTYVGPDLTVTKSHVGNFTQGQTGAQYTISVANAGSLATNGTTVTVTDTLPAGLTATAISGTGWTCVLGTLTCTRSDALAAGSSYPAITLTVNVAGGAGSPLVNSVTVSGGGDVNTTNNTDTDSTTVNVNGPDLIVTKNHTGIFYQGQTGATYTITVSNIGSAATNGTTVTVTDTLPAGLTATAIAGGGWTCVLGTLTCTRSDALAAGSSYPGITLTVNVAGGAGSPLVNSVTVSGGGDVNTTNNTDTDSTTVDAGGMDLTVTKSHAGNFTQGQNGAQYTIIVTNIGTANTTGRATVTDTLPAGLTFVSGSGTSWNNCTAAGQVVTCRQSFGQTINAGASAAAITLTVNVALNAATPQVNTATVSGGGGGDVNPNNNTATDLTIINQLPDLTVTKSHTGNFYRGQTGAAYTITVSNISGAPTTAAVTVTDTLPAGGGLTATAISGTGWTCVLGTLTCTRSDVLAAGSSYPSITLTVNVGAGATGGNNTATVSGGGAGNATATDPTTVNNTAPDMTVTKSHVGNFSQGQNGATYKITVSNVGNAATTAAVTVSDTLPTGLTYVSGTGTGWTGNCGALGQIVTCTRSDVLAAGSSYPALTLTVNVAGNAGSPQVNSVTVGGGGETYTANDTATDSTTVTVSLLPDLTVAKTHNSVFYLGQIGAQYTITVSNIGAAATTGTITVTDTLPTGLTYVSGTGTGWTCGAVGQVVTCSTSAAIAAGGSLSGGSALTLTVNVSPSAPYTLTNTASVSLAGQSESNYNNNLGSDTVTITPTVVTLIDFQAYNDNGQVVVQWETASEHNTLGFHIFRLDAATGQYRSLTQGLLPGLMTFPIGGTYTIIDSEAIPGEVYRYELVEVETNGKQITYGPFTVTVGEKTEANSLKLLKSSASASVADSSSLSSGYSRQKHEQSALQEYRLQASKALRESTRLSSAAITPAGSRIKIPVREDGIYFVDAHDIASLLGSSFLRVSSMISGNQLSLSNQGHPVAYLPGDSNAGIYFYGTGTDSIYTRDNIYWIDSGKGTPMGRETGRRPVHANGSATFTDTLHIEQDLIANMQVNDPNVDYWAWNLIFLSPSYSDLPEDFTFTVNGKADTQATATMQVHLVGGSDTGISPDHHVIVSLNGQQIGEGRWGGLTSYTLTATFSQSLINEGENTIEVAGVLDPGIPWSMFLIDSFDLTYERLYEAVGNRLVFTGDGNQTVTVGGFTTTIPDILLFNISDPWTPKVNASSLIDGSSGNYEISFNPASRDARYLAVARDAATRVSNAMGVNPSGLQARSNMADYLVIVPEALVSAVQPLADYRRSQGMRTMVVKLDDIMNDFNFGISSPEAIRQFLSYAYYNWIRAPRYVVLAGAGTWDYRDNLGKGGNLIPPALVPTPNGLTTSDNYLADVNGDHVPEMAIGRLPVLVPDDLTNIIKKIKTFESSRGNRAVLFADSPDNGGDFTADSEGIAAVFPLNYVLEKVYLAEHSADDAKTMLSAYLNNGSVFFNYIGHGGIDVLSKSAIFASNEQYYPDALQVDSLVNGYGLPVMVAMTCTVGDFAVPGYPSLSESMLLKSGGGAAAVWSATGLSDDTQAKVLNKEFYKAVFSSGKKVLGDAVLQALTRYGAVGSMPFMMEMYTILGDPALRIK